MGRRSLIVFLAERKIELEKFSREESLCRGKFTPTKVRAQKSSCPESFKSSKVPVDKSLCSESFTLRKFAKFELEKVCAQKSLRRGKVLSPEKFVSKKVLS